MKEFDSIDSISLESISLTLGDKQILSDLDLTVNSNGINSILGPNGSGKTLTNKIISLLLQPNSGNIKWNNISVSDFPMKIQTELRRNIGYMAQKPVFLKKNLFHNIELPLVLREYPREQRRKLVKGGLSNFELDDYENSSPYKLSIGQQQRASFLRTIIYNPKILILDEPTSSLDPKNTLWFENYLKANAQNYQIILLTTHDQFQVKRISSSVNFIIGGKVVHSGSISEMNNTSNEQVDRYLSGELDF
ncbi:MAG: ATP-binding cassette domain-containing protein [Candidatus Kariarchaeaceae archaeon]